MDDCPYCDIRLALRWTEDAADGGYHRYGRCLQCQTLFLLTSAGWEDENEWIRYGLDFPTPQREPPANQPPSAAGSG